MSPSTPQPGDRRGSERHVTGFKLRGYLYVRGGTRMGPLEVRDLSRGGLGLVLDRAIDPATVTAVSLYHKAQQSWSLLEVEGAHVAPWGAAGFLLGASFPRALADAELREFLC